MFQLNQGRMGLVGGQRFSPAKLFAGGVQGFWYDPSDATTLFSDRAGTTPCAIPGAGTGPIPVGLMLDKSQGLVLGPELVTNGGFDSNVNGWNSESAATISWDAGTLRAITNSPINTYTFQDITTVAGRWYKASALLNRSAGSVSLFAYNGAFLSMLAYNPVTPNGVFTPVTITFLAVGTTTRIAFGTAATTTYYADNISVKEIAGNHAIAANDTTARPELSARVNLLTYSEQFDNGVWTKTNLNTTGTPAWVNVATAPDGSVTADKAIENTSNVAHYIQKLWSNQTIAYTWSIYLKAAERTFGFVSFRTANVGRPTYVVVVNLATGVATDVVNNTGVASNSYSISDAGNGWWRITLNVTNNSTYFGETYFEWGPSNSGTPAYSGGLPAYLGDGTSGVLVWGADLRPANIGSTIPAYQRVADQYTYDNVGFPRLLRAVGSNTGMYTPSTINLGGDAVTAFAGVRKQSDAALGIIMESSATIASNNGAFLLSAPNSAEANYNFSSKGTVQTNNTVSAYAAPISNVVTAQGDISDAVNTIRVNGLQVGSNANPQGTGNYGAYSLNLFGRNAQSGTATAGTILNGDLYSAILVAGLVSSGNVSSTEGWIAGKMGIVAALPTDYNFLTTATGDQLTTAAGDPLFTSAIY